MVVSLTNEATTRTSHFKSIVNLQMRVRRMLLLLLNLPEFLPPIWLRVRIKPVKNVEAYPQAK